MDRELTVRMLGLYLPIVAAGASWVARHCLDSRAQFDPRRLGAAVLLACAWNAPALLIVQWVATSAGWWSFGAEGALFAGTPVDLYLGWIVLWGAVPVLAFPRLPVPAVVVAMVSIDVIVMPLCAPVVQLGSTWLVGEAAAVGIALVPSLLLARWTLDERHLAARATLQIIAFSGLMLLVIPAAVLEQTGGTFAPLFERSARWTNVWVQILAIPTVVGLSAVQEFVTRGGGTPIPFDPPRRLVTSGPYAYIANPMQVASAVVLLTWAGMLQSFWMLGAGVMAIVYGAGLATWHEQEHLTPRFGRPWLEYRRHVRQWWPRWKPFVAQNLPDLPDLPRLYVAASCATCRGVGEWLMTRGVIGLQIVAAEDHPNRTLLRITYDPGDGGTCDEGVAAFARALEHINLGWAWFGMFIRLPIVRSLLQIVVDGSGGYARAAVRR